MSFKKWKPYVIIMSGIIVAFITHSYAVDKLLRYAEGVGIQYNKLDFFNLALLTTEFSKYDYLTRQDYTLGFLPFLFLFFGTFIISFDFLMKPKSYQGFLIVRENKRKNVMKRIKGRTLGKSILFACSFMVTLYLLATFNLSNEFNHAMPMTELNLVLLLIIHTVVKILALQLLCGCVFLFYQLKDTAFSFLGGAIIILFLYMINLQWSNGNIFLFYGGNYFIDSIIILFILNVFIYWYTMHHLKLDYLK